MTDPETGFSSSRYTVERELGRGGMGIVLLARDLSLDRLVAIKLLPPGLAAQSDLRERFLREVRIAASLSHPNIVPIFSVEETDGAVYYVMGYIDGETLTQRVRRTGPLSPSDAAQVLKESAWALGYAHGRGIVHRDVKPDNIMIERATGRTFVTDFGIARAASSAPMTGIGETLGTPHSMSPEQAAGEPLDGRSDIYSLGVVGFYALTGRMPFDAPTVQAILAMHLTRPAPPVTSIRASVPPMLAAAIDRCLAKEPSQRFESGEALVTAIQGAQVTRAEIAPPVKMFQRVVEMSVVQILTVALLMVVIGLQASRSPAMMPLLLVVFLFVMLAQLRGRARSLMAEGFLYEDVRAAFDDDTRERERARAALARLARPGIGTASIVRMIVGLGLVGGGLALGIPSHHGTWQNYGGRAMLIAGVAMAMLTLVGDFSSRLRIGSRSQELTARLWLGGLGRLLFRAATPGAGAVADPLPARANVAPESLTGLVAALKPDDQAQLGEMPELIEALEREAQALATREQEIGEALIEARRVTTSDTDGAGRVSREALVSDLESARATLAARRGRIAGTLEEFRIGLIRTKGGISDASRLRAQLESAGRLLADGE